MTRKASEDRAARRFHLAVAPDQGPARLAADEARHLLQVLRFEPGQDLVGLDGRGAAWPLRLSAVEGGQPRFEPAGEPEREARPGSPGARLAEVELVLALPRPGPLEEMLDRVTQLGVSRVTPWLTERTEAHARSLSEHRKKRLARVMIRACKQSGRLWFPELGEHVSSEELSGGASAARTVWLDPRANTPLAASLTSLTVETPLRILVGPEGGLSEDEGLALQAAGFASVRLAPYTLRVETAAESAMAIVAQHFV